MESSYYQRVTITTAEKALKNNVKVYIQSPTSGVMREWNNEKDVPLWTFPGIFILHADYDKVYND